MLSQALVRVFMDMMEQKTKFCITLQQLGKSELDKVTLGIILNSRISWMSIIELYRYILTMANDRIVTSFVQYKQYSERFNMPVNLF